MYPYIARLGKDWRNLRSVYLDAVFQPLLREVDFRQEGWRLERHGKEGREGGQEWNLTGVVYNEMKGALSDADNLFATRHNQQLMRGTAYANISGGDPRHIPGLSYDDLVQFHRKHYNPANSLLYSYGRINLDEHLEYLDQVLSGFAKSIVNPAIKLDKVMLDKRGAERIDWVEGAIDPMMDASRQVKMLLSFVGAPLVDDPQLIFNMKILSSLLLDGPAAPLHQALIDSNIGTDYAPGTGFDISAPISSWHVGLQGISLEDVSRVEELTMDTLRRVRREGFATDRVEALLHQVELGLRYHASDFGLGLAQKITSNWTKSLDMLDDLEINRKIARFRHEWGSGGLFESLVDRFILNNKQGRLLFVMRPDPMHVEKETQGEREQVALMINGLSGEELEIVDRKNMALREAQDSQEQKQKELLPCLRMQDINTKIKPMPFEMKDHSAIDGTKIFQRMSKKANGIGYFKAKLELNEINLSKEEISLLPLMSHCLTELGCEGLSIEEFDSRIKANCAGISAGIHLRRPDVEGQTSLSLLLSTHALMDKVEDTLELFKRALLQTRWTDVTRIKTQLALLASSMNNSLASNGHGYAKSMAASQLSRYRQLSAMMMGIPQMQHLNRLLGHPEEELSIKLMNLARRILDNISSVSVALIGSDKEDLHRLDQAARIITSKLSLNKSDKSEPQDQFDNERARNVAIPMPFSTNYVAQVFKADPFDVETSANLTVLARLLPPIYLHREIREKGGAYGGGSSYNSLDGLFSFYSYRDPAPLRTLETIAKVGAIFKDRHIEEQELLESKLAVFSALDAPVDLAQEGLHLFSHGISDEERQTYRDALLRVSVASLKETMLRHLGQSSTMCSALIVEDKTEILERLSHFSIIRPSIN